MYFYWHKYNLILFSQLAFKKYNLNLLYRNMINEKKYAAS